MPRACQRPGRDLHWEFIDVFLAPLEVGAFRAICGHDSSAMTLGEGRSAYESLDWAMAIRGHCYGVRRQQRPRFYHRKGYVLELPREWLVKYGPSLRDGLSVLKFGLSIARCAGLPLPEFDAFEELAGLPTKTAMKAEARAVVAFDRLLKTTGSTADDEGAATHSSKAKSRSSRASRVSSRTSSAEAATGNAYRALKELIQGQCQDRELLHCGLEKAVANDGAVEWVSPQSKERFIKEG